MNAIVWTKFEIKKSADEPVIRVEDWNFVEFANVTNTANTTKHTFKKVSEISQMVNGIPRTDLYIIENLKKTNINRLSPKMFSIFLLTCERYIAMTSLLNARQPAASKETNIYFLSHLVMGRLYNLLVGHEIVSTAKVTQEHFTPSKERDYDVQFNESALKSYRDSTKMEKEFLGRSMLSGITFYRLSILRCMRSLQLVKERKKSANEREQID